MPKVENKLDTRVDEFAANMFGSMGYDKAKLPDSLVSCYNMVKERKDKIMPGRLSAEGFAFVTILVDVVSGEPSKPEK